jgi:hypothetical protein
LLFSGQFVFNFYSLERFLANDVSTIEESYQTPNRIYIYLSINSNETSNFLISDYVFPDETKSDISQRIKQLFNYEIKDLDKEIIYVEDFPRKFIILPLNKNKNQNTIRLMCHLS